MINFFIENILFFFLQVCITLQFFLSKNFFIFMCVIYFFFKAIFFFSQDIFLLKFINAYYRVLDFLIIFNIFVYNSVLLYNIHFIEKLSFYVFKYTVFFEEVPKTVNIFFINILFLNLILIFIILKIYKNFLKKKNTKVVYDVWLGLTICIINIIYSIFMCIISNTILGKVFFAGSIIYFEITTLILMFLLNFHENFENKYKLRITEVLLVLNCVGLTIFMLIKIGIILSFTKNVLYVFNWSSLFWQQTTRTKFLKIFLNKKILKNFLNKRKQGIKWIKWIIIIKHGMLSVYRKYMYTFLKRIIKIKK